jgi:serine/threonine-protein kinase
MQGGAMQGAASSVSDEGFAPGQRLPGTKYKVARILGEGGMGVVYECVKEPGIRCAVKVLRGYLSGDAEHRERFLREVRLLAELSHPNIVRVFDYDVLSTGAPFFAMELLAGKPLSALLAEQRVLPPRVALKIMTQLLSALHCAHTHSTPFVHRDVKPDNIFLHTPPNGESSVKLLDFSIATFANRATMMAGTWGYMAPEQLLNQPVSEKTDLYAAAVVLFEMLTGAPPFATRDLDLLSRATLGTPAPRLTEAAPWVPASVADAVAAALEKDPAKRPANAKELADRLSDLARDDLTPVQSGVTVRDGSAMSPRSDASLTVLVSASTPNANGAAAPRGSGEQHVPSRDHASRHQLAPAPSRYRDFIVVAVIIGLLGGGAISSFLIWKRATERYDDLRAAPPLASSSVVVAAAPASETPPPPSIEPPPAPAPSAKPKPPPPSARPKPSAESGRFVPDLVGN